MQVEVHFFSYLRSAVGTKSVAVSLPETATLTDLTRRLQAMYPGQAGLLARAAYLIDRRSAESDTALADGMQVLVMMILSGG